MEQYETAAALSPAERARLPRPGECHPIQCYALDSGRIFSRPDPVYRVSCPDAPANPAVHVYIKEVSLWLLPPLLLFSVPLCGLPAHRPLMGDAGGHTRTFCCHGCRQVYQILTESHALDGGQDPTQTTLYQQCLQMGLIARSESAEAPSLSEGGGVGRGPSSPTLPQSAFGGPSDTLDATREAAFQIGGMWCAACAWLIEATLQKTKGVTGARVFFASDVVKVTYKPARTGPEELLTAVRRLGYTAENYAEGGPQDDARSRERRAGFVRAVVAIIFAINVGMFSLALYTSYFRHAAPQFGMAAGDGHILTAWSLALSLPVLWAGWPIFRRAWLAARQGAAVMETLIALGSGTAFLYSLWVMAHGGTHVYFETADMLLALTLVGKHLETGARSEASGAIALLYGLLPQKAVVLSRRARNAGRRLQTRRGRPRSGTARRALPADGVVVHGTALVDESLLTGEARPVLKTPGDAVTGGTVATDAPLMVSVSHVGDESTLAQMIALVEAALSAKSPAERWTDKISRVFVPVIILLALGTAGVLALSHAPAQAILVRAVSVLVIACPCALGLATPLAITTGVGLAARRGILISNPAVLEVLPRVRHLLVDKTGTLTEGRFAVRETVYAERGRPEDWAAIAALETASEHPLARALVCHAEEITAARPCSPLQSLAIEGPILVEQDVANFTRHDGQGVTGTVSGTRWFVGNAALCSRQARPYPLLWQRGRKRGKHRAGQPCFMVRQEKCAGQSRSATPCGPARPLQLKRLRGLALQQKWSVAMHTAQRRLLPARSASRRSRRK